VYPGLHPETALICIITVRERGREFFLRFQRSWVSLVLRPGRIVMTTRGACGKMIGGALLSVETMRLMVEDFSL
jgi:hypothetical protein